MSLDVKYTADVTQQWVVSLSTSSVRERADVDVDI
jgi:hypothetical protein